VSVTLAFARNRVGVSDRRAKVIIESVEFDEISVTTNRSTPVQTGP
jgi:hypothetical protein